MPVLSGYGIISVQSISRSVYYTVTGVCNKNFSGADFRAPNLALALKPAAAQDHASLQIPHVNIAIRNLRESVKLYIVPSLADAGNRYFSASKSVVELLLAP